MTPSISTKTVSNCSKFNVGSAEYFLEWSFHATNKTFPIATPPRDRTSSAGVMLRMSLLDDLNLFALSEFSVVGNPPRIVNLLNAIIIAPTHNRRVSSEYTARVDQYADLHCLLVFGQPI